MSSSCLCRDVELEHVPEGAWSRILVGDTLIGYALDERRDVWDELLAGCGGGCGCDGDC